MSKKKILCCTIYGLREVGSNRIRYVGQTSRPLKDRLKSHWQEANKGNKTARSNWMRSVRDRGGEIEIAPIEENAEWNRAEIEWIARYREIDDGLLNHTGGGQGSTPGQPLSDSHREACRKAQQLLWANPEMREKASIAAKAERATPEGQARMKALVETRMANPDAEARRIAATIESRKDPEFRRKMSEAATARMSDPAEREKLRALNVERMKDPANREKASKGAKSGWDTPEKREKRIEALRIAGQKRREKNLARKLAEASN